MVRCERPTCCGALYRGVGGGSARLGKQGKGTDHRMDIGGDVMPYSVVEASQYHGIQAESVGAPPYHAGCTLVPFEPWRVTALAKNHCRGARQQGQPSLTSCRFESRPLTDMGKCRPFLNRG